MSVENLKNSLPEYAKDLKLNLSSLARSTVLTEQQLWGALLASAAATRSATTLREIAEEAADRLSAEAYGAALGAASIMAMNNVFYRGKSFLDGRYDDLRAGLRMQIIGSPGVAKADFELWSFAVSSINGCGHCVEAHENTLREAGLGREEIFEALRAAAIVAGVGQAVEASLALAGEASLTLA
ncbi:MAG: alkyl hydroperoxide reductase [Mycobacteriaceae bacterium]|nr:alkyl hydroperoxide reductase [Mycobacteriaceae bacterium]